MLPRPDPGSFRDPGGVVLVAEDRVYRAIMPAAAAAYEQVRHKGVLAALMAEGWVVDERPVAREVLGAAADGAAYVVEHPKLPFISYPYEWCFHALKAAALLQLDVHLRCLEHGVTLSDASAYNVQFLGPKPIFIDTLSFRPYREGEIWAGHRQFCEQYLNPLLLRALLGIPHNAWFRGSLEGISVQHLDRALPLRAKLSWNVIKHVVLQAALERMTRKDRPEGLVKQIRLPLAAFRGMLIGLRSWISALKPADSAQSVWGDYAENNSYAGDEARKKADFIREFAATVKPAVLWDLGCNTGEYSKIALQAGAKLAVGFDFDVGALERAYLRAGAEQLNLLPLLLDATNPSPSQGWAQQERKGLVDRASGGAVLALALVHHLAIARNVPLPHVVDWVVGLAPRGVIEFVPKNDPMVAQLLMLRDDIFPDYLETAFANALQRRARIHKTAQVSATGRTLYWFERT